MTARSYGAAAGLVAIAAALGSFTAQFAPPNLIAQEAPAQPDRASVVAGTVLPRPDAPFRGRIGLRTSESEKDFPAEVRAPAGAPNVIVILTDDVGFGASSTFGGPIPTPTFDRLAASGLRFNQFHTTALCSPTRAALLTGRNHQTCATGCIMEAGVGYPGYHTLMPKSCGTVAEILKQNGYNTAWFGKNHNVPDWHTSQAGPFDLWPIGLGFEQFYGFIGGDTNQWDPAIVDGIKPVEPPHDPDYHFDVDLADRAIAFIRQQNALAPDKPFFAYYCPGTAHAPHHAPKEWIEKFAGQFDQGWDAMREETLARQKQLGVVPADTRLTPPSEGIPAWDSLDADQKKVYARMMEVYAGALSHCDHQIGRVIEAVRETGELDNTLVIYIQGDNGASAEGGLNGLLNEMTFFNAIPEDFAEVERQMDELGGPTTFNHYPIGWAHCMNTPMQWAKQVASHYGGTRNGMVMSWPARIADAGGLRSQWHHVIDITPTILEAVGVPEPTSINGAPQTPIEGVSMAYTFDDAAAASRRTTQYFEMFGNRGIYHDGWLACTTPTDPPWAAAPRKVDVIDDYEWELYHVAEDFSEAENLAASEPARLHDMQLLFYAEAAKHQVLPIDNSKVERLDVNNRPSLTRGRTAFTYYPGMVRIPEGSAPDVKNRSFSVTAEVEVPDGVAQGMLITQGGRFAGWGLYLLGGRPVFHYNLAGVERYEIASKRPLAAGKHVIRVEFAYDGGGLGKGGTATLFVNDSQLAEGLVERTLPFRMSLDETLDIGADTGTPVAETYQVPFEFSGTLEKVTIELK